MIVRFAAHRIRGALNLSVNAARFTPASNHCRNSRRRRSGLSSEVPQQRADDNHLFRLNRPRPLSAPRFLSCQKFPRFSDNSRSLERTDASSAVASSPPVVSPPPGEIVSWDTLILSYPRQGEDQRAASRPRIASSRPGDDLVNPCDTRSDVSPIHYVFDANSSSRCLSPLTAEGLRQSEIRRCSVENC